MQSKETPKKLTFELPRGWHAAMQQISDNTGVSLKYLYSLAVDRLLSDMDAKGVEEAAWEIERRMRQDPRALSARHSPDEVGKRYTGASGRDAQDVKSKGKKA